MYARMFLHMHPCMYTWVCFNLDVAICVLQTNLRWVAREAALGWFYMDMFTIWTHFPGYCVQRYCQIGRNKNINRRVGTQPIVSKYSTLMHSSRLHTACVQSIVDATCFYQTPATWSCWFFGSWGFFSVIKNSLNFLKGGKSGAGTQEAAWHSEVLMGMVVTRGKFHLCILREGMGRDHPWRVGWGYK